MGLQHVAEVLHHHVGVVIRLEEPVGLLQVVLVQVQVRRLRLGPQVLPPLVYRETHRRQIWGGSS